MWKLFVLHFAALHCAVFSIVPSPVNVIFSSVNLRNELQWQPGNGTPSDRHFTVQYAIYGDSFVDSKGKRLRWRAVKRCTGIVQRWCDLSSEMWDVEHGYVARVRTTANRASSKWVLTGKFDPALDTSFGPPLVSIEVEDSSAIITLKGPLRYQPNHEKPEVNMASLYPQMMYNLSIHNTHRNKMSHIIVTSDLYKHKLMEYDTEYCFSAKTKFLSMPIQCQSSAWHCISTPPDPIIVQLQRIILSTVIPFVFMCVMIVIIYLLYHYLNGSGQKTPSFLNGPFTYPNPLITPDEEKPSPISRIHLYTIQSNISEPSNPKHPQLNTKPLPPHIVDMLPARGDVVPSWKDETSDYGVLAVDSQQKQNAGEVDQTIVERKSEEKTPQVSSRQSMCPEYASQNPIISDSTLDAYGLVGLAACGAEKNDDEQEEDEQNEKTSFISWDLKIGKLMSEESEFVQKRGFIWSPQESEAKVWGSRAQEGEVSAAVSSRVLLENVFVRQSSEEAAEAQVTADKGLETESKVENFLPEWELVFSMD